MATKNIQDTTKIWICEIDIGNPKKTRDTYDSLFWFRYKTFYYLFEFKVFRHEERERHDFFLCWLFHQTPPRAALCCKLLVWPRRAPEIDFLPLASNLNSVFSKSKILSPSLPGMTSFTSPVSFPIWRFYCDICDCHIRPAHAWTPALNVCT